MSRRTNLMKILETRKKLIICYTYNLSSLVNSFWGSYIGMYNKNIVFEVAKGKHIMNQCDRPQKDDLIMIKKNLITRVLANNSDSYKTLWLSGRKVSNQKSLKFYNRMNQVCETYCRCNRGFNLTLLLDDGKTVTKKFFHELLDSSILTARNGGEHSLILQDLGQYYYPIKKIKQITTYYNPNNIPFNGEIITLWEKEKNNLYSKIDFFRM